MFLALILAAAVPFETLAPGVEYAATTWADGTGAIHVVRIDPATATLRVALASEEKVPPRTAAEWADGLGLTVAINAGMFDIGNHLANVGHLHSGAHVNQAGWNKYQSVFVFGSGKAAMVDLDEAGAKDRVAKFETVIQNLRLIRGTGKNMWKASPRKWSEAAVAVDATNRVVFVFSRAPLTMKEFDERLLALPLGITRAMHAEGGPEASLSIRAGDRKIDLCGSYETGFNENDDNRQQWPIPNVIGVVAR